MAVFFRIFLLSLANLMAAIFTFFYVVLNKFNDAVFTVPSGGLCWGRSAQVRKPSAVQRSQLRQCGELLVQQRLRARGLIHAHVREERFLERHAAHMCPWVARQAIFGSYIRVLWVSGVISEVVSYLKEKLELGYSHSKSLGTRTSQRPVL